MANRRIPPATVAQVVDDYRAGAPVKVIAARHKVSPESIRQFARKAGLGNREGRGGRCPSCTNMSTLYGGLCRPCRDDIPLTDGRWMPNNHGVQVWVPDPVVMHQAEWHQIAREAS